MLACAIGDCNIDVFIMEPSPQKLRQKSGGMLILGVTDNFDNNEKAVDVNLPNMQ